MSNIKCTCARCETVFEPTQQQEQEIMVSVAHLTDEHGPVREVVVLCDVCCQKLKNYN